MYYCCMTFYRRVFLKFFWFDWPVCLTPKPIPWFVWMDWSFEESHFTRQVMPGSLWIPCLTSRREWMAFSWQITKLVCSVQSSLLLLVSYFKFMTFPRFLPGLLSKISPVYLLFLQNTFKVTHLKPTLIPLPSSSLLPQIVACCVGSSFRYSQSLSTSTLHSVTVVVSSLESIVNTPISLLFVSVFPFVCNPDLNSLHLYPSLVSLYLKVSLPSVEQQGDIYLLRSIAPSFFISFVRRFQWMSLHEGRGEQR